MAISASKLRENIYSILDEALETGVPVEVVRKGKTLRIVPETKPKKAPLAGKLSRLKKRDIIVGDPEDLVHIGWSKYWNWKEPE
jgi:antitoxin (DNA-binding transcriptional repressor) of toxin-antitoxin stability system